MLKKGRLKVINIEMGDVLLNLVVYSDMVINVVFLFDGWMFVSVGCWMDGLDCVGFGNGIIFWDVEFGECFV